MSVVAKDCAFDTNENSDRVSPTAANDRALSNGYNTVDIGKVTLFIEGMTCDSCSSSVVTALEKLKGLIFLFIFSYCWLCNREITASSTSTWSACERLVKLSHTTPRVPGVEAQKMRGNQRAKEIARHRVDVLYQCSFTIPAIVIMMEFTPERSKSLTVFPGGSRQTLIVAISATPA